MKGDQVFQEINSEEKAREFVWKIKFGGKDFTCPKCAHEKFWQRRDRNEVRLCQCCRTEVRLRQGTIFQDSKAPILAWLRAIHFVTQGKRGISALELTRHIQVKSYDTCWLMLHKIREALRQKDEEYKLKNIVELDGATFGKKETGNQAKVLIAIESKDWIDAKGRPKSKAGFAKVVVADETKKNAQDFVDAAIVPGSMVNSDGGQSFRELKNVDVDYQVTANDPLVLDHWLPWVHKFISNAKVWINGTYHGVDSRYLGQYLAEYTYRFNRRHDPDSLFHRGVTACVKATQKTKVALSR